MPRLSCLTFTIAILWNLSFAHGGENEGKVRAARKACLSGDYITGVELLSDLFIDTKDPTHLFNQARCFEQNNRCNEAIARFREYLRKAPSLAADEKAETEKHITECQALLGPGPGSESADKSKADEATGMNALQAEVKPPVPSTPLVFESLSATGQTQETPIATTAGNAGYGLRVAGITCGLVGIASFGAVIYYYRQAIDYSDKVSGQNPPNKTDEAAGRHAEKMQWVFSGVGTAALVTGTVLYILGRPKEGKPQGRAQLSPILGSGLTGLSVQGTF
jgi:hypothetical protein